MGRYFIFFCDGFSFRMCRHWYKNVGVILPAIDDVTETAVFVTRQTGFQGSGQLVDVVIDGITVGSLGNGEFIHHSLEPGNHNILAKFKGIGGLSIMNKEMKTFSLEPGEKVFYTIDLETGLITNKLKMMGVTKETFVTLSN